MIMFRTPLTVALAALMISGLGLAGCEKAANGGPTPVALDDSVAVNGSTVPDLPALNKPFFSPDLVDRVGGIDLFAIAESKLALTQSQNPKVKAFANDSIEAHNHSLTGLGDAIDASGQTISYPDVMSNELVAKLAALKKVEAGKFDKIYAADQVEVQRATVSALQSFAKHGDVAQFKAFASNGVAAAESHLTAAETLQSSLK